MHSIAALFFRELDFELASTLGYTVSSADGSLPPGAHSSSLEVPPGRRSRSCHDIWHCGHLPRRSKTPDLSALTCLHLLRLPIQVPLIPPPLRSSVALIFTIERSTPFPIDSRSVPYPYLVPYPSRLTDVTLRSYSVRVRLPSVSTS